MHLRETFKNIYYKYPFLTPLSTYFSKVLVYLVFKISVKTIRILGGVSKSMLE